MNINKTMDAYSSLETVHLDTIQAIIMINLKSLDTFDTPDSNKLRYLYYNIISHLKLVRNITMKLYKSRSARRLYSMHEDS